MRRLLPTLLSLLAVALLPSAASAALLPGKVIDGPSADVKSFGDVALAPDGTGALAYVKAEGGVDHIFVSTLAGGTWSSPQRVDTGLTNASKKPTVAAANGGRVVVTYVNGPNPSGTLESSIRPNSGSPFQRVTVVGNPNARYANVAMDGASGVAYVAFTDNGFQVRAYRLAGTAWTAVGAAEPSPAGVLNNDATQQAGTDDSMHEARVAVTPNGDAAITWGEPDASMNNHVYARRLNGTTVGPVAQGDVATLNGKPYATAEESDVDVDGTGRAWVTFREQINYGGTILQKARGLVRAFETNGTFGPVQVVDDFTETPSENAEFPRIDVNPAGQGLIAVNPQDPLASSGGNRDLFSGLAGGTWSKGSAFNVTASDGQTFPVAAIGDQGAGVLAWSQTKGTDPLTAHARQRVNGALGADLTLSRPELGTVNSFPLEASSDSKGNVSIGFSQGAAASRAIVVAMVDGPPAGGGGGGGGGGPDKTAPKLASVKLSATRFRLGSLLPKLSAKKRKATPTGTTISFKVDEDSKTALTFKRVLPGRKVGKRCLAATKARKRKPRCTRLKAAGRKLTYTTRKGSHKIRFQGRFTRKSKLAPGTYEVTIVSTDAAKNASKAVKKRFTLLPALQRKKRT